MTASLQPVLARATNLSQGTPPAAFEPQTLDLAIQGGAALSAYGRGVLDAVLNSAPVQEGRLRIRRITGGSGGLTQGAVITHALNSGKSPSQAAGDLDAYWNGVAKAQQFFALNYAVRLAFQAAVHCWQPPFLMMINSGRAAAGDAVLQGHRPVLEKIITDPEKLHQGPVELYASAVRKKNPRLSLHADNVDPVIFSGKALNIEAIMASTALEERCPIVIDSVPHWDPVFHPTANPCLAPLQDNPADHTLIIAVDPKGIHRSCYHGIEYGHIYTEAEKIPGTEVLSLPYNNGLDEKARLDFSVASLEGLRRLGYNDLLAWIRKFEQNHPRLSPEMIGTYENKVA